MTSQEILEKVFEVSFTPGHYASQLASLDAQGLFTLKRMQELIMGLLEALDDTTARQEALEKELSKKVDYTAYPMSPTAMTTPMESPIPTKPDVATTKKPGRNSNKGL